MWGAYFCMGAHKHDEVVVMKMGAYIHGVLILCGCLLSRFYGTMPAEATQQIIQVCICLCKSKERGRGHLLQRDIYILAVYINSGV